MSWRIRAFREVRDELDRFLNFPVSDHISLGDYGTYDGKRCSFEWLGNLSDLGIAVPSAGHQTEMVESYNTTDAVAIQGRLALDDSKPMVDIQFSKRSAITLKAFDIGYDSVQLSSLGDALAKKVREGLRWDRSYVIITKLWSSVGFTQIVAGGNKARIEIKATAPDAALGFNFSNPSLGLIAHGESGISYSQIGRSGVKPYFVVHKLRRTPNGGLALYRYAE